VIRYAGCPLGVDPEFPVKVTPPEVHVVDKSFDLKITLCGAQTKAPDESYTILGEVVLLVNSGI